MPGWRVEVDVASFFNQAHFERPASRMAALGTDLNPDRAITDAKGNVLAYAQTGGILGPVRHELHQGDIIFRFGAMAADPAGIAKGAWWFERAELEKLLSFANTHGVELGLAVRLLCLVPPEWSDLGRLIRARLQRPLLAYRGLANSVVIQKADGLGAVRLPHQNEIAARRLHQLYIPGLKDLGLSALSIEQDWAFDPGAQKQGWLYL